MAEDRKEEASTPEKQGVPEPEPLPSKPDPELITKVEESDHTSREWLAE